MAIVFESAEPRCFAGFGVPLSTIMLSGRWGNKANERYVQDAELDNFTIVKRQRKAVDLEERIKELATKVEALQVRPGPR